MWVGMKHAFVAAGLLWLAMARADAHSVGSTPITWNREISRIVYDRCASCHRPGGNAFSLMTYLDAQPRANEIKDSVLSRRMPPWGAVKGFGTFRNDQSLMQEQIELITRWVDGGIRRGNNPRILPSEPKFATLPPASLPTNVLQVSGPLTLRGAMTVDGLLPERVPSDRSLRVVAMLPDGRSEPLVWLHGYKDEYSHPFFFRNALRLPAGTMIQGVPPDAVVALIPAAP